MTDMNLRLSRELLRLCEYLCNDTNQTFQKDVLLNKGHPEAYILCEYLGEKHFVYNFHHYIGVSPAVKEALIKHADDLVKYFEKQESDRELSNREKVENITFGRKGYRLSRIAIALSALAIAVEIGKAIAGLM